ncbi:MAG: hypothetical protein SVY53_15570 [Chloroflexota bacterium]|nr:hypothetical protein [Chloroflexota bacterium]
MNANEISHVVVLPPASLEGDLVKNVASIVHTDAYGARRYLVGQLPQIIAHYQSIQAARSIAQQLKSLGLMSFACMDSELRESSPGILAYSIQLLQDEIRFYTKAGHQGSMTATDITLVISGRARRYVETENIKTRTKINVPATVITGGIPIVRRVKETSTNISNDLERCARLYPMDPSQPMLELQENHMDYSCLGTMMGTSASANFTTVLTMLRDLCTNAAYDDRLSKPSATDDFDRTCKLILMCHLIDIGVRESP